VLAIVDAIEDDIRLATCIAHGVHISIGGNGLGVRGAPIALRQGLHPAGDGRELDPEEASHPALIGHRRISRAVKDDRGHRPSGLAFLPGVEIRARRQTHSGDPLGESARHDERRTSTIGESVGVDARWIDVVLLLELIDQVSDERDVPAGIRDPSIGSTGLPAQGKVRSGRVDDDKPLLIGQIAPVVDAVLQQRQLSKTMQGDHQRRRLRRVIGRWHMHQIVAFNPGGYHGSIRVVD